MLRSSLSSLVVLCFLDVELLLSVLLIRNVPVDGLLSLVVGCRCVVEPLMGSVVWSGVVGGRGNVVVVVGSVVIEDRGVVGCVVEGW